MKKKLILFLTIITTIFAFSYVVKADSGWDFDYDSGGSDWSSSSSSDWGSSSWDYDDYDRGSSGGGVIITSDDGVFFVFFFGMVIFIVIFFTIIGTAKKFQKLSSSINSTTNNIYNDLPQEKINEIDNTLQLEEFKKEVFEIYKKIQIAWMDFDYDTIRENTTDELFNMYNSQLETLKVKKQKNIMSDFTYNDAKVYDIRKEKDAIIVKVYLFVKCYDYVVKEENNEVVRGNKNRKACVKYELTFVKSATNHNKQEKCPNCGAPVDINSSAICPYCDSTLVKLSGSYVLSKKTCVGQYYE